MHHLESDTMDEDLHKRIVSVSLKKYSEVTKRGKPKAKEEWTPLSTILCLRGKNKIVQKVDGTD